jgi:predicted enzyme related to lactoylglutathione lyase
MANGFCWYELRTKNVEAARAFYTDVVGLDIRDEAGRLGLRVGGHLVGEVSTLPERAAALGAPSHWLGHISVPDVEAAAHRWVALGAERLGPSRRSPDGTDVAIVRDPFGTVVALTSRTQPEAHVGPAWHELHTQDHQRASSMYADLFGWRPTEAFDLEHKRGTYQMFSWPGAAHSVGGMLSSVRWPGVHPHWLFYFQVDDLDRSLRETVSRGGSVSDGPHVMPSGARVAPCEDPQGAAFALQEPPPRTP